MIPFAEHWNVQHSARSNSWSLKFAFRYSFRAIDPPNPAMLHPVQSKCTYRYSSVHSRICTFRHSCVRKTVWNNLHFATVSRDPCTASCEMHGLSRQSKCASPYSRVQSKIWTVYVLVQWRAQKCMKHVSDLRSHSRPTKTTVTTVFDVWRARNDETVARRAGKFAFRHSFGRPMSTKWREGCLPPWPAELAPRQKKTKRSSLFSAAIFSRHLAVVRAWSAIEHHPAVVRGWWSAIERHLLVAIYDNVLWKNPLLRFSQLPSSAIILLW